MNKYATINFDKCEPSRCDSGSGVCEAARACKRKLLVQEEAGEAPLLLSEKMCVGCGTCVPACPLGAIQIKNG